MNTLRYLTCMGLALIVSLLWFYGSRTAGFAEEVNQCFSCHTSARNLILITREIAKAEEGKPRKSAETKGEG